MLFRVYVQKTKFDIFEDTGVRETNPEQQANWREICSRYGYNAFRFIPDEEEYRLRVPKRHHRKRGRRKNDQHTVGTTGNGQDGNMPADG